MTRIVYQDFDLLIQPADGETNFRAKVLKSITGDASATFCIGDVLLPGFPPPEGLPEAMTVKTFGGRLFKAVFKDDVLHSWRGSLEQARRRRSRLRIRLNLTDVPALAKLPWEYLHNPDLNHFYATSEETPVVRYQEQGEPIGRLSIPLPLRILVMIARPKDRDQLDVQAEWDRLQTALKPLVDQGLVSLHRLDKATTTGLIDRMRQEEFHIFHFIGHGEFDEVTRDGVLVFEDNDERSRAISGQTLGLLLRDHPRLRLAVINACEGGRIPGSSPFEGVAQSLLRQGRIPAVIAMQFKISDGAAIMFAHRFYTALADAYPVDAALSNARKVMYVQNEKEVEWGTPVLYMRSPDGRLFDLKRDQRSTTKPETGTSTNGKQLAPSVHINDPLDAHYTSVIDALTDGQLVPFLGLDINIFDREPMEHWAPGAGLPGYLELAEFLSRTFAYPSSDVPSLGRVSQYAVFMRGIGKLDDTMSRIFTTGFEPNALHRCFASLPDVLQAKNYPRTPHPNLGRFLIVTTTYDDLLENAFKSKLPSFHVVEYTARGKEFGRFLHSRFSDGRQDGETASINIANDYAGLSDQRPVILKLQGAADPLGFEQKFAITEDHNIDYLARKDLSKALPPQLLGKLKRSGFLFLGYNVCHWNLRALLYRLWDGQKPSYESWAVHPNPQEIDRKFWKECGVEIIHARMEDYVEGLNSRLKDL